MRAEARLRRPTVGVDRDSMRAFVLRHLERAAMERRMLSLSFPAPRAPLTVLVRASRRAASSHWVSPGGAEQVVATGATATVGVSLESLKDELAGLFDGLVEVAHPDAVPTPSRVYGGVAFDRRLDPERLQASPWADFGQVGFVLPRWTYALLGAGRAQLGLTIDARDGWSGRARVVLAELDSLWDALERPLEVAAPTSSVAIDQPGRERYRREVETILAAIAAGDVEKVVLARRAKVKADADLDPWSILETLGQSYPQTWRFGFRRGPSTFVGATPERLFRKRGRIVETEALAGSVEVEAGSSDRLQRSGKDRREHAFVVDHLLDRLGPLTERLVHPEAPEVRALPNVLHLRTPIRGELAPEVDAVDLLRTLHPTPAVNGTPMEAARAWIAAHEGIRGWYTGAAGWLDAAGDGELVVALRCGLFRGAHGTLFAGGGIVAGSDPDGEWDESGLKLRPLLQALQGSSPPDHA
jgi:menaquinone-specific isochorismate synthase